MVVEKIKIYKFNEIDLNKQCNINKNHEINKTFKIQNTLVHCMYGFVKEPRTTRKKSFDI